MTWFASLEYVAATGVGDADGINRQAAMAAETSARAPGVGNRKVFLSTNASAGADGGGEAIPDHARREPGAGHGVASEGGMSRSRAWGHRSAQ
jgi:hypothetical protein